MDPSVWQRPRRPLHSLGDEPLRRTLVPSQRKQQQPGGRNNCPAPTCILQLELLFCLNRNLPGVMPNKTPAHRPSPRLEIFEIRCLHASIAQPTFYSLHVAPNTSISPPSFFVIQNTRPPARPFHHPSTPPKSGRHLEGVHVRQGARLVEGLRVGPRRLPHHPVIRLHEPPGPSPAAVCACARARNTYLYHLQEPHGPAARNSIRG